MEKLYAFIGSATHQDSPDGLEEYIAIAEDIPAHFKEEVLEDSEDAIVKVLTRAEMDSLSKSLEVHADTFGIGDGHILDLVEDHMLCWDR